tara:strand:- start:305 stop:571 length:267 start_codon:yes stop_codon:yes gene_type:complete
LLNKLSTTAWLILTLSNSTFAQETSILAGETKAYGTTQLATIVDTNDGIHLMSRHDNIDEYRVLSSDSNQLTLIGETSSESLILNLSE